MRACVELENAAAVLAAYGPMEISREGHDIEPSVATRELAVAIANWVEATRNVGSSDEFEFPIGRRARWRR